MQRFRALSVVALLGATSFAGANAAAPRDGSHDFDFNAGVWHTHIVRLVHPMTASHATVVLDGTVTVRAIWGGKASIEEIEADGPKGHWEGMTLFLYDPAAHHWTQTYLGARDGAYAPGDIGSFAHGRGDFSSTDTVDGKPVLVHGVWSDIAPTSHRYRILFSGNGGRDWQTVFDAHLTRLAARAPDDGAAVSATGAHHDFDFEFGTWSTRSRRLIDPLSSSHRWVTLMGVTVVRKVWGGRANYAEVNLHGPGAPPPLLALRWYSPETKWWNLDFANARTGTFGTPASGTFVNGRIDFTDREPYRGRPIDVRFSLWNAGHGHARSEQAFSTDGKAWETNWKTDYTESPKRSR